jgi:hypothetical protein
MWSFRILLLVCLVATSAMAAPNPELEARTLFDRGKESMSAGRFAEASDLFQRSLLLVPKPSAAFNLAVALRGMGRPKESAEVFGQLLAGKYGTLPAERRAEIQSLVREVEADVSTLEISAGGASSIDVRVDGLKVATITTRKSVRIRVNPGERVVTLSAKQRDPVERRVTLAAGKSARVSATLTLSRTGRRARLVVIAKQKTDDVEIEGIGRSRGRIERRLDPGNYLIRVRSTEGTRESEVQLLPATEHRVELDTPGKGGLLSSPWFWVGAGVVVTGAAVGGYFLFQDREREPVSDPQNGITETLTRGSRLRFNTR